MVRVLMFSWEFPPYNSGGLGIACQGLTRALSKEGADLVFVLPKKLDINEDYMKIVYCDQSKKTEYFVNSPLKPYLNCNSYVNSSFSSNKNIYGLNLIDEVIRYGEIAQEIAKNETFDIIHAHDWLSMKAGIAAKKVSKKPLIVHIHATEFDRTGGNYNPLVYEIEKEGLNAADIIITVSQFTKNKVIENYGINPEKIRVVHNGTELEEEKVNEISQLSKNNKIVLFVGRITIQKGPDYFIDAAKKVLEKESDVLFIISGSGDMERQMIEKAASMGISDKVLFAGFLRGKDLERVFKLADVFVMPSISEPFGLVPIESMNYGTPAIISKQSGVSEVITHCLKVDFWDINEMASKILAVLHYPPLKQTLSENGRREAKIITWQKPAQKCITIYKELINNK
jgi:glycosyltransferase involved in cell wall biosynthesis